MICLTCLAQIFMSCDVLWCHSREKNFFLVWRLIIFSFFLWNPIFERKLWGTKISNERTNFIYRIQTNTNVILVPPDLLNTLIITNNLLWLITVFIYFMFPFFYKINSIKLTLIAYICAVYYLYYNNCRSGIYDHNILIFISVYIIKFVWNSFYSH